MDRDRSGHMVGTEMPSRVPTDRDGPVGTRDGRDKSSSPIEEIIEFVSKNLFYIEMLGMTHRMDLEQCFTHH